MSTDDTTPPQSPDELRDEIEHTRDELAETIGTLASRLDVKARAQHRVQEAKQEAAVRVGSAWSAAAEDPRRTVVLVGAGLAVAATVVALMLRRRHR